MGILQELDAVAHLTPDEIVARIGDPFPFWTQGQVVTEAHDGIEIAICHRQDASNPERNIELGHKIRTNPEQHHSGFSNWNIESFRTGVFRQGGRYWFRSRKSWERNRNEGFTPDA